MKKTLHIIGSVSRTLLGLTFIFSGFVKAVDPLGTTYKIEDYLKAFGGFFTNLLPLAQIAAWCLICFEFVLGICLLANIKPRLTTWLALLMMLLMTPLTLYLALTNPISDCGCFGDAVVLSNWQTFIKNIILLLLVLILILTGKYTPRQTFTDMAEAVIAAGALLLVCSLMLYTRLHLPLLDFRPYKIGNNIPELMEYPEDAEPDKYETLLIYEREGVQQTFTLQDYPRGDSTWTFVDQQTKLVKKGFEPPIHDFEIITLDGDDLTDDVLSADRATLVVMYDLQKAGCSKKRMEKMQKLFDNADAAGEPCYILTGSGEQEIQAFCDAYEWLSPARFCLTDPVTLKTIVRANPGVIVLENGTITDKYNLRNR